MMRVMLVDRAPVFCCGFRTEIEECDDIVLMAEVPTVAKAIEVLQVGALPHVVVTDIKFEEESVLSLLEHIRSLKGSCRVLVLAEAPEEEHGDVLRKAGAHGYVEKDSSTEVILEAIRQIGYGKDLLSEEVTGDPRSESPPPKFTEYITPFAAEQGIRFLSEYNVV